MKRGLSVNKKKQQSGNFRLIMKQVLLSVYYVSLFEIPGHRIP